MQTACPIYSRPPRPPPPRLDEPLELLDCDDLPPPLPLKALLLELPLCEGVPRLAELLDAELLEAELDERLAALVLALGEEARFAALGVWLVLAAPRALLLRASVPRLLEASIAPVCALFPPRPSGSFWLAPLLVCPLMLLLAGRVAAFGFLVWPLMLFRFWLLALFRLMLPVLMLVELLMLMLLFPAR